MEISINYLAVLVASIASMIVGFLWYSPILFGKQWAKLNGYTEKSLKAEQKKMSKLYGFSFLAILLMAYILSHVISLSNNYYGFGMLQTGLTSAFFMWLGFVMPIQFTSQLFGREEWKLFFIDTGYQLASLTVMGVIIGIF
jgi:hypothetical protein